MHARREPGGSLWTNLELRIHLPPPLARRNSDQAVSFILGGQSLNAARDPMQAPDVGEYERASERYQIRTFTRLRRSELDRSLQHADLHFPGALRNGNGEFCLTWPLHPESGW